MLLLGFAAGLPLLMVFGTLSAWLREAGVSRTTIGFFSAVTFAYGLKFLWSPAVDRAPVPSLTRWLGRRRSWMLLAQILVALGLVFMGLTDPRVDLASMAVFAAFVAFASATQDIALDAYRIESAPDEMQGATAATYSLGYRLGMLVAGAVPLYLADLASWTVAYCAMAATMGVGAVVVLLAPEAPPAPPAERPDFGRIIDESVVQPFADFFRRHGWRLAILALLFAATYRLADMVLGVMAIAFYKDLQFTNTQIASVSKLYGFAMTIAGGFLGGALVARWGALRTLLLGTLLSAATNLLFVWLAGTGPDIGVLAVVISADNLAGGLASVASIAFLSGLTSTAYTATQYALLSAAVVESGRALGMLSGWAVDKVGYEAFFLGTAALGIPSLLLGLALLRRLPESRLPEPGLPQPAAAGGPRAGHAS
ncbi:MAG: MFS transporter [Alphaproteobacteria bacterium]|nr:MFS transporter [Alphaproteobacteria bacterium]